MTEPLTTYRVSLDVAGALASSAVCPACGGSYLRPGAEPATGILRCRGCGAQWRDELGRLWRVHADTGEGSG